MLRLRIWSACALLICVPAVVFAGPAISGYPSDMSDVDRINLLADWGYFQEAVQEIDSMDAEKYSSMRERWKRVDSETRRILRRASPESKAYESIPQEIQRLAESLQKWQSSLSLSAEEAAQNIADWKAEINKRRLKFDELRSRYDLPKLTHPSDILAQEADMDKDGRKETVVIFWVQPKDKIERAGEQFIKVLRPGATAPVSVAEFSLGEPRTPQMSFFDLGNRRMLVVETFPAERTPARGSASPGDDKAREKSAGRRAASEDRKDSVVAAFIFDGDRLAPAFLAGDGPRRPLLKLKRSSGASASDFEFQDGGKRLVMTFQQEAMRNVFQQGVGTVKTLSRREFRWDGKEYGLQASKDTVLLTGSVFLGSGYVQALPKGLSFAFAPIESGWEMVVRSTQAAAAKILRGPRTIELWQLKTARVGAGRTRKIAFEGGKLELVIVNLHYGAVEEAPYSGTAQVKTDAPLERMDFSANIELTQ